MGEDAELATLGSGRADPVAAEASSTAHAVANDGPPQEPELPALHSAARTGDYRKVAQLLRDGADVSETAPDGTVALHWAASGNSIRSCELLLDAGADLNFAGGPMNATPLHWAARSGLVYIVDLFIERGALPESTDDQKSTALHLAVHSSNVLLVIYLVHLEVNVDAVDVGQRTPLHWAAYQGDHLTVECLLKAGASPQVQDSELFTPLHWGLVSRSPELVTALLQHGADLHTKNRDGKDAFVVAMEMDTRPQLLAAFEATARDKNGDLLPVYFGLPAAKVVTFIWPFVALWLGMWLATELRVYYLIPAILAITFVSHKLLKKFVLTTAWPGRNAIIKSTLFAGVYNAVFITVCVVYALQIFPVVRDQAPILSFVLFATLAAIFVLYMYTAYLDPGIVRPGNIKSKRVAIKQLLKEGKYTSDYFDINHSIRKPLRSDYSPITGTVIARFDHYCPWVFNDVGVRNHRAFLAYCTLLSAGLVMFGILVVEYLGSIGPRKHANILNSLKQVPGLALLLFITTFQATWIFFLTLIQHLQVCRALTSHEAVNLAKGHRHGMSESFSSLPLDHSAAPEQTQRPQLDPEANSSRAHEGLEAYRHHHGGPTGRRMRTCLNLLGVRQLGLVKKIVTNRPANSADHGVARNLADFWGGPGSMLNPQGGYGRLNGEKVDYYTLWMMPGRGSA